jgi:hypothetical protein
MLRTQRKNSNQSFLLLFLNAVYLVKGQQSLGHANCGGDLMISALAEGGSEDDSKFDTRCSQFTNYKMCVLLLH